MCDLCNLCDFIRRATIVIGVISVIFQKHIHIQKTKDRNMCDLCNLWDFLIRELKLPLFVFLSIQCDWDNFLNFSKKFIFSKLHVWFV